METKEKLLIASTEVFTKNGYLGSSTKAIAKQANVSEMTLFRKFNSKQNLFEKMIKYTLGHELSDPGEFNFNSSLKDFVKQVLHNRLTIISKHINLVRMIIQESLQGRLKGDLNYVSRMSDKFYELFHHFCQTKQISYNDTLSEIILGIILHYAILKNDVNYDKLTDKQQEAFIDQQLQWIEFKAVKRND